MIKSLFSPGHTACAGCGQAIAVKLVVDTIGSDMIVTNATGCLEVFSAFYPYSSWNVPFIHSLFENSAAVASGIQSALLHSGNTKTVVVSQAGDGGTADIGLQALSGAWERGQNILSICFDNEAYMNTGIQRSGLTPYGADTTTSPAGKKLIGNLRPKKNMVEIALAHNCVYVATATVGYPVDLQNKIKKAITLTGPKYVQILVPCPLGWRHAPELTYEISRLAVQTALFPLVEYEHSQLTKVLKLKEIKPPEEYLKLQNRFKHLFTEQSKQEIEIIRQIAQTNIKKYNLSTSF